MRQKLIGLDGDWTVVRRGSWWGDSGRTLLSMTDADAIAEFLLARIAEEEPSPDTKMRRDLIEWALGIETLRELGDPAAPVQPHGEQVLRIMAGAYGGHAGRVGVRGVEGVGCRDW